MENKDKVETKEIKIPGLISKGRGGGQPKPKTPSGQRKPWSPPTNDTTPANRVENG